MLAFLGDSHSMGASGALVKMQGVAAGGNSTLIYFACDDCAVEANRVVAAGGRVQSKKMSVSECGFIVLAFDTEGNMFGLHAMK